MPFSPNTLLRLAAKLSRCLSLALLPALGSEAHALSAPQRKPAVRSTAQPLPAPARHQPYLAALGALPLRFQRADLALADAPPEPPKIPEPAPIASAPERAPPTPSLDSAQPPPPSETTSAPPQPQPRSEFAEPEAPPLQILPDDTPRELRAEDVLPFFRYPQAAPGAGEINVAVPFTPARPAAPAAPPSSATYQLK